MFRLFRLGTSSKWGEVWMSEGKDLGPEVDVGHDQQQSMTMTIETLEHKFVQETMQLTKELNDAEDKENARHREV